jgi:hypothetical protein
LSGKYNIGPGRRTCHRNCARRLFCFVKTGDNPFAKRELRGQNSLRTAINWKALGRSLAIYAGFGVFLAILNPFGSVTDVSFPVAALYWVSLIVWGGLAGEALGWLLQKQAPNLPPWAFTIVLSLGMTVVILPAVGTAEWLTGSPIELDDWGVMAFFVWILAVSGTALRLLILHAFAPKPEPQPVRTAGVSGSAPAAFLERLPIRLRAADLYAVESEDHYLRVHTSAGQELILMRLADAVRELSSIEGLQTHRSWWVAKQGLADVVKGDGRLALKLKSGAEAPVSRTYLKTVKEAGWL